MYRVYLRMHDQSVLHDSKTNTTSPTKAAAAFSALVDRVDLDGQPIAAVLSNNGTQMAFHRFDRPPGDITHWRGRLGDIDWPAEAIGPGRGGARAGAGRRGGATQVGDGVKLTPVQLDQATRDILTKYGDGNFTEGIRRAARLVAAEMDRES